MGTYESTHASVPLEVTNPSDAAPESGRPKRLERCRHFGIRHLDPNQPPPELLEWAKGPEQKYEQPHRFAVGVCLVSVSGGAEQRYWIDVGSYMSAIESILEYTYHGIDLRLKAKS